MFAFLNASINFCYESLKYVTKQILLKQKGYPMQATRNSENIDTRLRVFAFCKDVKNRKQEVIFFCRNSI